MFRKHGNDWVVKTTMVWPLIPANRPLTEQEQTDELLVSLWSEYQQFLANGNSPLEQEDDTRTI